MQPHRWHFVVLEAAFCSDSGHNFLHMRHCKPVHHSQSQNCAMRLRRCPTLFVSMPRSRSSPRRGRRCLRESATARPSPLALPPQGARRNVRTGSKAWTAGPSRVAGSAGCAYPAGGVVAGSRLGRTPPGERYGGYASRSRAGEGQRDTCTQQQLYCGVVLSAGYFNCPSRDAQKVRAESDQQYNVKVKKNKNR